MIEAIIIALTGTIILNLGFALQKAEVTNLPAISAKDIRNTIMSFLGCKKWLLGTGMTSSGFILFLIAVSMAPLSLIAPLTNVGILVIVFLAIFHFKEKLLKFEYLAFFSVLAGVFIISLSSSNTINSSTFNNLDLFIPVLLIILFLIGLGIIHYFWFPKKLGSLLGLVSGITGGLGAVLTKALTLVFHIPEEFIIYLILFAIFQGISFVAMQSAFQKERAIIIVPLFNSFTTIIPIIFGVFTFKEIVTLMQIIGILLILLGSSLLFRFSEQVDSIDGINA